MTVAEGPEAVPHEPRGEVRFLAADGRVRLRGAVEAAGWLLVHTDPPGPGAGGLLDKIVEEEIEQALMRRGAPASGIGGTSSFDALLDDQLMRAKAAGARGIALALGPLGALIGPSGALDPEDSLTLRILAGACRDKPFALWLADSDDQLLGYGPPVRLSDLLLAERAPRCVEPLRTEEREPEEERPSDPAPEPERPSVPWRVFMRELDDAQGPKPLAAVERLFVERYVPLSRAVVAGDAEARARMSLQRFAKSFEKSYREAFAASKVTRRRPPMVLDAPAIASRVARLHGARNVVLLLVDGMRFDVGLRVQELLQSELSPNAVCTEQVLLWSALPTVTSVQLDLIARGAQGLVEPLEHNAEHDMMVPRGKAASTVRRLRAGGRELHKLDVIQSTLGESGPREPERIEAMAQDVVPPIVRFAHGLQPRTLLFLFGDHGFELPVGETGTGPARQGGASPEQVLVPGQAWLIGGIH